MTRRQSRSARRRGKDSQRIILDLKDKIKAEDVLFAGADLEESPKTDLSGMAEAGKEAVEALTALGYSRVRGADRSKEGCDHRRYDFRGRAEGRVKASGILIG